MGFYFCFYVLGDVVLVSLVNEFFLCVWEMVALVLGKFFVIILVFVFKGRS